MAIQRSSPEVDALHVRAHAGDVPAMKAFALALLDAFDEEHFDPRRKRHVADLRAMLADASPHSFAPPLPRKLSPSARRDHALYWLREAARSGDIEASGQFATWLFRAGPAFLDASFDAFERAAQLGDLPSMLSLGRLCWHGCEGAAANRERARPWLLRARGVLTRAAEAGDALSTDAHVELGRMALRGEACEVDVAAAVHFWQQAAACGSVAAMLQLGHLYTDGRDVAFDATLAHAWYERALAAGDPAAHDAIRRLAAVRVQRERRAELRAHAEAGSAQSALDLARCFETGSDGGEVDATEATNGYRLAARRGHPLGMVETGKRLAEQSSSAAQMEAWFWLRLAQRAPWSQTLPAAALLASAASDRLSRQLVAGQRRLIDEAVAAARPDAQGWINPPALG